MKEEHRGITEVAIPGSSHYPGAEGTKGRGYGH